MNPRPEGYFRKPTPYPRPATDRRPPPATPGPRVRSGMAFSLVLHVIVLGSLVQLAAHAPAPGRFDVFAADPADAAPEHAIAPSPTEPPRAIVVPPKGRLPQPVRSPVASARARASTPS